MIRITYLMYTYFYVTMSNILFFSSGNGLTIWNEWIDIDIIAKPKKAVLGHSFPFYHNFND